MLRRSLVSILTLLGLAAGAWGEVSPRALKQGAAAKLTAAGNGEPRLDKKIDKVVKAIDRSLLERGRSLFIDDRRILPPPEGQKVFDHEREAVGLLLKEIKKAKATPEILDLFQEVIGELVAADRAIAGLSLETARALLATGQGDSKGIDKAERAFRRAAEASAAGDPRGAIKQYEKAWAASQSVVKDGDLLITAFSDSPDPFSPTLGAVSLSVDFEIRRREALEEIEENHKSFVVELVWKILDAQGRVVREIIQRKAIPTLLDGAHPSKTASAAIANLFIKEVNAQINQALQAGDKKGFKGITKRIPEINLLKVWDTDPMKNGFGKNP